VPRWTPTLKILLVWGEASAKPLWVIGVFWTVYPTPYRLFPGGDFASNDMGTLSSWMTVLPSPSPPTAGSIRREKRCWWFGARTPGLTTVPYGEVSPGKIACVDRIPVARVSKWRLAAWSNFQHRMYWAKRGHSTDGEVGSPRSSRRSRWSEGPEPCFG
jgi:hypothetical protein